MKTRTKKITHSRLHRNHGVERNLAGDVGSSFAGIKTRGSVRASLCSPALLQLSDYSEGQPLAQAIAQQRASHGAQRPPQAEAGAPEP